MEQIVLNVTSITQLNEQLQSISQQHQVITRSGGLVQLYTTRNDDNWIDAIQQAVYAWFPGVPLVGCSAMGVIWPGQLHNSDTALSLLIFRETTLSAHIYHVTAGDENRVGKLIATDLISSHADLQGVLLLATPILINCGHILRELTAVTGNVPVFGGLAGNHMQTCATSLFFDRQKVDTGVVVVAFNGQNLRIGINNYLGWQPFGELMTVTGIDRCELVSINDKPAYQVYHHFVGIERDGFFDQAVEFPLIVHRAGKQIARAPIAVTEDDHLMLLAPLQAGDQLQLGYGDVDSIFSDLAYACDRAYDFQPEAVLAFSCCSRLYFLMEDADAELAPYWQVAPVAGFFTLGEIDSTYVNGDVLNNTMVTVVFSESPRPAGQREPPPVTSTPNTSRSLNRLKRLMRFISRVTEQLHTANDELAYLASRDELTGTLNRRALMARLHAEWTDSIRHNTPLSIILLDIDHFKLVNDTCGHLAGDQVLVSFSELVKSELRAKDQLGRYGGEEFIILLPGTSQEETIVIAERIRALLEQQVGQPSRPSVTSSFGVAHRTEKVTDIDELLRRADQALYLAKQRGRNRVEVAPE